MPDAWLAAVEPLGISWRKEHLSAAPALQHLLSALAFVEQN